MMRRISFDRRHLLLGVLGSSFVGAFKVLAQTEKSRSRFLTPLDMRAQPGSSHNFVLLADFSFQDDSGRIWTAPKGTTVDGASVPRLLWPFVGSPWAGRYKEAAVIHDHFCVTKSRPWQATHMVFYEAMISNDVLPLDALIMYAGVYRFGPRWTNEERNFNACSARIAAQRQVSIKDISAMCHRDYAGRGRVDWQPEPVESDWSELMASARGGRSASDLRELAAAQLKTEPDFEVLLRHELTQ